MDALLTSLMPFSLIQSVASSFINAISGKRVIRARKGQVGGIHPLLALPLMMKILEKEVTRAGRGCKKMNHMDKYF